MPQPKLFEPVTVGGKTLANRIVIAPMCQYSAEDGMMNDWHLIHLGGLSQSGAGILTIEATGVLPEGRITYGDVGLYDDATEAAMARVLTGIRAWSKMPVAIQLGHAGRKASTEKPWLGGQQIAPDAPNGWQTVAPSDVPFRDGENAPVALDKAGLARVREGFADAARRAVRLGIDVIQIHAAHGYLLHEFLSPLANQREDDYGGVLANRARLLREVVGAVREVWPVPRPLAVRVSATDWVPGGWDIDECVALAGWLKADGVDLIDCSSGGLVAHARVPAQPGFQVPFAARIRREAGIATAAVGLITGAQQAQAVLAAGAADLVLLGREHLRDPYFTRRAAAELAVPLVAPEPYQRAW